MQGHVAWELAQPGSPACEEGAMPGPGGDASTTMDVTAHVTLELGLAHDTEQKMEMAERGYPSPCPSALSDGGTESPGDTSDASDSTQQSPPLPGEEGWLRMPARATTRRKGGSRWGVSLVTNPP
jgi:hypothetical protein